MTPGSIGDLTRATSLRQANVLLKSRLNTLTQEATTGVRSDIPAALNGNLGPLAQIETRLTSLAAWRQNATGAAAELAGLQEALGAIQDITSEMGPVLLGAAGSADPATLDLRAGQAAADLRAVAGFMNVDLGGRYLMAGAAVRSAPIVDPGRILATARTLVAGQPATADVVAAVDAWLDAPPGAGGFADAHGPGGLGGPAPVAVGADTIVANPVTALDPSLRDTLKGLVLAALAGDAGLGYTRQQKADLMAAAGQRLSGGNHQLTLLRASVGLTQDTVEQADTRNGAQQTALSLARSNLVAADPYETASALTQTEGNLQTLYALTARLSRLSLTDYL